MDDEMEEDLVRRPVPMGDMSTDENAGILTDVAREHHGPTGHQISWLQRFPKRYIVAVMAFLGFLNIYALRVNLSVAIVAMTANHSHILPMVNGSRLVMIGPDFDWDSRTRGLVLGSFFYGYIITQLPGGYMANRLGGKYVYGGGIFITALLTLLTPVCARWSVYLLIAIRIIEGLFEGVTYPAIHAIWSKWAPPIERTTLATIAFSGSYFGTVISLPISGALSESRGGWPSIFYFFGSIAVLWFLLWCILISESPAKHPSITNHELEYIQGNIGYTEEQTEQLLPPWFDILKSPAVWAIVLAHFAENWGFYTWLTELPTFMESVMHFSMVKAGFVSSMPYLVLGIVVISCGFLADYLRANVKLTTAAVRKLFTCGAFGVQMIFMIAAGYTMTPVAGITCLTIAVGLGGFAWGGFSVNHLDIAPQYASILMGLSNTFATIPGVISPSLTAAIVPNKHDANHWQIVFYIAAIIYLLGAVGYGVLASGVRQKWAEIPTGYLPHLDPTYDERDDT